MNMRIENALSRRAGSRVFCGGGIFGSWGTWREARVSLRIIEPPSTQASKLLTVLEELAMLGIQTGSSTRNLNCVLEEAIFGLYQESDGEGSVDLVSEMLRSCLHMSSYLRLFLYLKLSRSRVGYWIGR
jgi:hypothetical protein